MKVYISSTYRDLREHRQTVATLLRRMGHQPIGMEDYVAEGVRPLHRCLEDVASCDVFVGIVAWRYGFIPQDAGNGMPPPIWGELGKTSITEFEFRQAVDSKKPTLIFLLDPEAPWPSTQIDAIAGTPEDAQSVSRFRRELAHQYLISHFHTPEDLASLVGPAVYRQEMSRQMDLESLRIGTRLNAPYIRNGPVESSTLEEIQNAIAGPENSQALQINIGQGREWWATRLYFLSSLAADLTTIEVMVFLGSEMSFVGVAHPRVVKERLAKCIPALDEYERAVAASASLSDLAGEVQRRANLWTTHINPNNAEGATPKFVTERELERWLTPHLMTEAIDWGPGDHAALQIQRLIDWPFRFVPVTEMGRFARMVDKRALTEHIARLFVREQVSRAVSTTR